MSPTPHDHTLLEQSRAYYWYHAIELAPGIVTDGDYDMSSVIANYGLPLRFSGGGPESVLDVGCASGYFSFECERRGAAVTATELASFLDWDFVGGSVRREEMQQRIGDPEAFTRTHITGAFRFAHQALHSKVRTKSCRVYDLDPALFAGETFDFVLGGSIMSHVRDPVLALERLRAVTRQTCILAVPTTGKRNATEAPVMHFVGMADPDRRSWWVLTDSCLVAMLRAANFASVEIVSHFDLVNRREKGLVVPHTVVHARP